jgi:hypothetical protein
MKRTLTLFSAVFLLASLVPALSQAARPKIGGPCQSSSQWIGNGAGKVLYCVKSGNKLVWSGQKAKQSPKPTRKSTPKQFPKPTPTPTESGGGSQGTWAPSAGAPCPQLNQQTATIPDAVLMGKTFTCIQSGKKLVWNNGETTLWNGITGATTISCKGTSTNLTAGIVDPTKLAYIKPLGGMSGAHVLPIDHIYVIYPNFATGGSHVADPTRPITSPAGGSIIDVGDFQIGNNYPYPDYRVTISHSCNLFSIFTHVSKLIGPAADILHHLTNGHWEGNIPIKSGEAFADASIAFEYTLFDQTKKLTGLDTPSFAGSPAELYVANILDYLPASLEPAYEAKFLSTTAPIGGKVDWNVVGSAQGDWFVENTNGFRGIGDPGLPTYGSPCDLYTKTDLAIVPDNIARKTFIYSFGDWAGCWGQFVSKDPTIDSSKITSASGTVVIELAELGYVDAAGARVDPGNPPKDYLIVPGDTVKGLLAIRVNADNSLTVEKLPGATSKSSFTGFDAQAQTYVR